MSVLTTYKKIWINSSGGIPVYATLMSFPVNPADGSQGIAEDTHNVYVYNSLSTTWVLVGGPGIILNIGTLDTAAASINGAVVAANQLVMQSASPTKPGLVNNTTQSFSGNKTFVGTIVASNLSGTNTGDVSLGAFGSAPNAKGASIAGQVLTLQPANTTNPGALTAADWTIFNNKASVTQSIVNAIIFG